MVVSMKKLEEVANKDAKEKEEIEKNTKKAHHDFLMDYAPYLIIIFFVVVIRIFVATPVKVNGSSMYPTLHNGDTMILYKLTKHLRGIRRFDIVVIDTDSGKLIKRVIGLPGDNLRYTITEEENGEFTGTLYVNDEVVDEAFLSAEAQASTCNGDWNLCTEEGVTVPEDEYFVMGDNRENSKDSRMIGTIPASEILGTTEIILFPFDRSGSVE